MWKKLFIICCVIIFLSIGAIMAWNHFVTSAENRSYKEFYNATLRNKSLEKKRDSLQILTKNLSEIFAILSEPLEGNEIVQYESMLTYIKIRKDDPGVNLEEWEKKEKEVTEALAIYKKNMKLISK